METATNFLVVGDDNYIKGMVAQINSIYRHFQNPRIYLVHNLNQPHLSHLQPHIYSAKKFNKSDWNKFEDFKGHVTKTNFGKFQTGHISESLIFYLDSDAIIVKQFDFEHSSILSLDTRTVKIRQSDKYYEAKKAIKEARQKIGVDKDLENEITLYTDGGYFANPKWIDQNLKPAILKASEILKPTNPRWYGMGYLQIALALLNNPGQPWTLNQYLVSMDQPNLIKQAHILHFLGKDKPWNPSCTALETQIWQQYYLKGPVPEIT
jgi:lipopolysaccharide biosynthesis glycosyltransferase